MRMTLLTMHILAGTLGIIFGAVALYVAKGAAMHRKGGLLFVYAMATMGLIGAAMAAIWGVAPQSNIPAGLLTAYLAVTGLTTVRPATKSSRRLDIGLLALVSAVGIANASLAVRILMGTNTKIHWFAIPLSIFASIAFLSAGGDIRILRHGALRGAPRIARHLWRMTFAMLIATFSFFVGQAKILPKQYQIFPLLSIPPLVVLALLLYWLWRVRFRRSMRGLVGLVDASVIVSS